MNGTLPPDIETLQAELQSYKAALELEHQRLEETQQEFEVVRTQYDELYNFAPVGYFTIAGYDTILETNLTGADMLGVRRKHIINHAFTEFITHEDHDIFFLQRRELLKTSKKQLCELRMLKKDGTQFCALVDIVPVKFNQQGEILQFRAAVNDISHHKRTVEALWESEFRYGIMFNNASDMILIYNPSGKLFEVNQMTGEQLRYSQEKLWQMTVMDIEARGTIARLTKRIQGLQQHNSLLFETSYLCSDGATIPVEVSCRMITYRGEPAILSIARDITKRKQTEEALRESRQRYKRITDAITDYIYTVHIQDGEVRETVHRPSCIGVTGYTPEEFKADPYLWIQMVHKHDHPAVAQQAAEILAGKKVNPIEHRIIRKDGAIRWVRNTFVPCYDQHGQLATYDGLIQDITERKETGKALQESENRFRMLTDFIHDWESWIRTDGSYIFVSPSCERVSGYPPEEFYTDPEFMKSLIHPDDLDLFTQHSQQELKHENALYLEFRIITRNGEICWLSHACRPVYRDDGKWLGRRASNRDITERKQTEEALQESQAYHRAILEAFDGLIYVCSQDHRIEFMNAQLIRRTGHDATGELCYNVFDEQEGFCCQCVDDHVFNGKTIQWEVRSPRDNRWYYVVNTPLYHADGRISKQAMILDISDRKQVEEKLRNAHEQLEATLDALPDLLFEVDRRGQLYNFHSPHPELLYVPPEDFLGKTVNEVLPEQTAHIISEALAQAVETGKHFGAMYPLELPQGFCWFELSITAKGEKTPEGRFIVLARDVTERKQAEKALRESKERYQRITRAITDYIYTVRIENNRPVETIHRTDCEVITGYTVEELQANPYLWIEMVHGEDRVTVTKRATEILASRKVEPLEHRIIRKDGTMRWVRSTFVPHYDAQEKLRSYDGLIQDITERKEAEMALQESEERLRLLIESAGDMIEEYDLDGKCIYYSGASRYGVATKDLLGKTPFEVFGAEIARPIFNQIKAVATSGQSQTFEKQVVWEGDAFWFSDHVFPVRNARGNITAIAKIRLNITERKHAENALRESEERYRRLVELSPDAILVHQDKRYIYANAASVQLLGAASLEELMGKSIFEVIHPNYHLIVTERIQQAYGERNASLRLEEKYLKFDGQEIDVEVTGASIMYHGKLAIQAVIRDITERKRSEQALRGREAHYRALFEDSPISLWEEDFSAVKSYIDQLQKAGITDFRTYFEQHPEIVEQCAALVKVVRVNKATVELYNAGSEEELHRELGKFFTQETYAMFREQLLAIAEGRTMLQQETLNVTLTGEYINSEMRWAVVPGHEDTFSKVIISVINITERKRAEEKLKQTMAELQRSNIELEHFAYVASHELRQPLVIIDTHLEVLAHRYKGKLDADADAFIARTLQGIDRMQETIKDLLDYSHINARETVLAPTDCEIVLQKVLENLHTVIEEQHVVITRHPLPTIMANESQLIQVFHNLMANAIKFRQSDVTPHIIISVEQQGAEWIFSIQDNGIGLDPQHVERIFVIFERLHSRKKYPGTGIGLAICKKIIERHDGRIWVESQLGTGSTFYFTSPVALS